ncbi:hypothetical protein [Lepagella muris]|jgi:hypothetical protein|uniref:Uncharacterized protein n=1 Tax=Lepagella muris TaxID=3032870 RepID=A0AC61RJJ2_9BACT|nr:hypothetical protein [Lepagella muris]ROT08324.1 hypothetical protein EEL33_04530 [Muribaculaceae bacterium Isolate-037 (Harlan)]TGY79822.1 hypothetical protein E5331_05455 [Lepagella muris]THG51774.1 hypothetical protein E5984_09695 [Bacteroidales bacterium]TKC54440.1 hypothetical protein E5359_018480 [Bacteroidales bacterium]
MGEGIVSFVPLPERSSFDPGVSAKRDKNRETKPKAKRESPPESNHKISNKQRQNLSESTKNIPKATLPLTKHKYGKIQL